MGAPQGRNQRGGKRNSTIGILLLLIAVGAFLLWQSGSSSEAGRTASQVDPAVADPTETNALAAVTSASPDQVSDLPPVAYEDLPSEAHDTILLIDQGGPFPYDKDGSTFQNREGLLPDRPSGFYAEYTVITPGSDDRGARRIVAGDDGELYYTDDHYSSFKEVIR